MRMDPFKSLLVVSRPGGMASPWDRLAAFIVDVVFIFPFVQILQAPWRRGLSTASVLENQENVVFLKAAIVVTFLISFFVYRTFCHYYFRKTLGKKIMGLELVFRLGRPNFYSVVTRSFVLYLEFLLMCVPFFAVFTHFRRRVLHDRISNTFVVSQKKRVTAPKPTEKWRGLLGAGIVAVLLLSFSFARKPATPEVAVLASEQIDSEDCEIFKEASSGSFAETLKAYALRNISDVCLKALSEEALWSGQESVLANLGMAFAEADNSSSRSAAYKKEVCHLDASSTACQFVEWTNKKPLETVAHWDQILSILQQPSVDDFYRIFFITALQRDGQYANALEVIRSIQDPQDFSQNIAEATFESLMQQEKWDAGYWVFKLHGLPSEVFTEFVVNAYDDKVFSAQKILVLIESFYPSLNVETQQRKVASEHGAPARIKMLWIRLQGAK